MTKKSEQPSGSRKNAPTIATVDPMRNFQNSLDEARKEREEEPMVELDMREDGPEELVATLKELQKVGRSVILVDGPRVLVTTAEYIESLPPDVCPWTITSKDKSI